MNPVLKLLKQVVPFLKRYRTYLLPALVLLFLAVLIFGFIPSLFAGSQLKSAGEELGAEMGLFAGTAAGSADGFVYGLNEGGQEGKVEGLSANDTKAAIGNEMKSVGNLEVLIASVKVENFLKIGEKAENVTDNKTINAVIGLLTDAEPYALLQIGMGNAVFSVDLTEADIQISDTNIVIDLPPLTSELYFDQSSLQTIAEYKGRTDNLIFNGSAEAGFDSSLNTMKKMNGSVKEALNDYQLLEEQAVASAKEQVARLASATAIGDKEITVNVRSRG